MKHQTYIAGVKFRPGAADYLAGLKIGQTLSLEAEPDNEHDPNAVKVMCRGFHLGYVPRDLAPQVKTLLEAGRVNSVVKTGSKNVEIHYA